MRTVNILFRGVALLLAMLLLSVGAFAEDAEFTFALNDAGDGYVVTGYTGTASGVKVPDWYNQKPVTEIGGAAFQGNTRINSVSLPSTITRIGVAAFKNCTALSSVISYTASAEPPVAPALIGDADDNGVVDIYDALLVMQYDAGWNVSLNVQNSDMNADNSIDLQDALQILEKGASQQ